MLPGSLEIGPSVAFGHAQEGTLNGSKVHVKRVRVYPKEDPQRIKKVYRRCHYVSDSPVLMKLIDLQPISCCAETLEPPKYCAPSGRHHQPASTRFGLDALRDSYGVRREPSRCG